MLLIKCHEKQLSFLVLNLLADYARTIQHKQTLQRRSDYEVVSFAYCLEKKTNAAYKISFAHRNRIDFSLSL